MSSALFVLLHVHLIYMHVHLMQVHYASPHDRRARRRAADAWRAFLTAHAQVTRRIGRDLAAAGLPDLGWYDLLWALRRSPAAACG